MQLPEAATRFRQTCFLISCVFEVFTTAEDNLEQDRIFQERNKIPTYMTHVCRLYIRYFKTQG